MTASDNKSYLGYLSKLEDEYSYSYHLYIVKKTTHADNSALLEEIESSLKASKFKVNDRVMITMYKNIFSKVYTKK